MSTTTTTDSARTTTCPAWCSTHVDDGEARDGGLRRNVSNRRGFRRATARRRQVRHGVAAGIAALVAGLVMLYTQSEPA